MEIIISLIAIVIILPGTWVIYNLTQKLEKLEKLTNSLSELIEYSNEELSKSSINEAFKADDEIGFFFETIQEIQKQLNEFTMNKQA